MKCRKHKKKQRIIVHLRESKCIGLEEMTKVRSFSRMTDISKCISSLILRNYQLQLWFLEVSHYTSIENWRDENPCRTRMIWKYVC